MEWKEVRLGDVLVNYDKKRKPLSAMKRVTFQGPYRYYGAQGVIDHVADYIFDGEYMLIAEDGENLNSRNQPIAQIVNGQFWVNNHAHIVRTNDKANMYLIMQVLNHMNISAYVTGAAQPKLNQENLNRIILNLPEKREQDHIASILSSLDAKIETNNKINAKLEEMAQALFKSWFVDFEPFKENGMEESELGMIPKGWRVGKLTDLGDIVGGSTPSKAKPEYYTEKGIAWLTPKDLSLHNDKFTSKGEIDITEAGYKSTSTKLMPKGSVLFSSRAPIGYLTIAKNDICTNQGFKSVVPTYAGTAYIYYLLKLLTPIIENKASGSTFKEASGALMKSLDVIIPPEKTLDDFESKIKPIFDKQENNESESSRLAQLRDTLLPKLMSGEIEV